MHTCAKCGHLNKINRTDCWYCGGHEISVPAHPATVEQDCEFEMDTQEQPAPVPNNVVDPLASQVGGNHYKDMAIQPVEFIQANKLGYIEGAIIKYACRHRSKGKAEDVRKIIHFAELLLQLEYGQ
jgi:hypothetical protein